MKVNGWVERPALAAAKEVTIEATNIPIDEALYEALPQAYRGIRTQFDLEGTVDALIELVQPAGTGERPGKWRTKASITLHDVSATYAEFPYPVEHLEGMLVAEGDRIKVLGINGRVDTGYISTEGSLSYAGGKLTSLTLALNAQGVACDDTLMSSLPGSVLTEAQTVKSCSLRR